MAGTEFSQRTTIQSTTTAPNRINQRAFRRRKRLQGDQHNSNQKDAASAFASPTSQTIPFKRNAKSPRAHSNCPTAASYLALVEKFTQTAYLSYIQGSPTTDHLLKLTKPPPPTLRPTPIQRHIPHHPWLDFLPFPRMRDNLIKASEHWDDEELCLDSWEATEAFLKKWPWVVRGCPELMYSTNAWRARRGERLIFRYT
ncbi:hypothetical protein BDV19DRAFT_383450 [Aspergillus venezuelensis]